MLERQQRNRLRNQVKNDNFEVVKQHIEEEKIDANFIIDEMQNSILLAAVSNKSFRIAEFLLKKGANVDHKNVVGNNALLKAICRRSFKMTKLLLEYEPLVLTVLYYNGDNILHYAIDKRNNFKTIKLLYKYAPVLLEMRNSGGETPLHYAIFYRAIDIVNYFLKKIDKKYIYRHEDFSNPPALFYYRRSHSLHPITFAVRNYQTPDPYEETAIVDMLQNAEENAVKKRRSLRNWCALKIQAEELDYGQIPKYILVDARLEEEEKKSAKRPREEDIDDGRVNDLVYVYPGNIF